MGLQLRTAGDLLIWNEALTNNRLGASVTQKLQEPAKLNNGRKLGYARGLFPDTYRGFKRVWHSGGASGYGTWLDRFPDQRLSVAVLCNSAKVTATGMANSVTDLFLPATGAETTQVNKPAAFAAGSGAAGVDVTSKAGLFFSERNGEPLLLVVNKGELHIPAVWPPSYR